MLADFLGGGRVLVVVAHPDDEALGCGGTIRRLSDAGREVAVLYVADGVTSRGAMSRQSEINHRRREATESARILGIKDTWFGDFPDNRLDEIGLLDLVQFVEKVMESYRPSGVLTHFPGDLNIDHQRVSQAVVTAGRPLSGCSIREIAYFETLSSTEWNINPDTDAFKPNLYVDISKELEFKIEAFSAYVSEVRSWPHPRSVESVRNLALWRGSSCGLGAAESFVIARQVV